MPCSSPGREQLEASLHYSRRSQYEEINSIAQRLFKRGESPGDVLSGRAHILTATGMAAVLDRAAQGDETSHYSNLGVIRSIVEWMSSGRNQTTADSIAWSAISSSHIVKMAIARALLRCGMADEVLQSLHSEPDGDDDEEFDNILHWTDEVRLEVFAQRHMRAQALDLLIQNESRLSTCLEGNDEKGEMYAIKVYTSVIRACKYCQKSALSILNNLEAKMMVGKERTCRSGIAVVGEQSMTLLNDARAAAVDACASRGDWETALGLLRIAQLRAQRGVPDEQKIRRKRRRRKKRLFNVTNLGVDVDKKDHDCTLYGCVPDALYLSTIRACCAGGAWQRAVAVVRDAEQCGVFTPELYSTAICALRDTGPYERRNGKERSASRRHSIDPVSNAIRVSLIKSLVQDAADLSIKIPPPAPESV